MKQVLLLGGTGFVGRSVCEALARRAPALRVVVPTRRPERAKRLAPLPTVQLVRADVHDEAQLAALLEGCDAAVHLVGILHGSAAAFERTHVELPRKLANACHARGVRRLVHVSALGANANGPSRYLRSKGRGEAVLREAALDLSVLRPSVIFGADDRFLNLFARLQSIFPVLPLAGAKARFQPVWVGDVALAIVRCLFDGHGDRDGNRGGSRAGNRGRDGSTIGATFECAGPQVLTLAELVRLAGRWSGHRRPVIALPDALGRLQALVMELVPGEPLMSRDNLDSMRVDNVASGALPGLAALGIEARSLESMAPAYLRR
jgi:NADH dehydrogenase